jgi:galactokinase
MKKKLIKNTTDHFEKVFHQKPKHLFLSPGRINIIGEHIDYNDGFVLPAAIDKYVCFAISKSEDSKCVIVAKDLNETFEFDWQDTLVPNASVWINYFLGVLQQCKERQLSLKGFKIVFSSTIPMGAGLSSSAALECGFAYGLSAIFGWNLSKEEIALVGQKAEHTFVGVNCGIMDQFASVFGKKNKVIKLDCNSLQYQYYDADFKKYSLLLIDSKVKHTHLTSGYNVRRHEVEQGLSIIKQHFSEVTSFRDCTEKQVLFLEEQLGETIFKRCHFVVKEIQRVIDATIALEHQDFKTLGRLMSQTHEGLSQEYEVSCPEIDFLVDFVSQQKSVLGSRMMGGGFGGCSINLIEKGSEINFLGALIDNYKATFGIDLKIYKIKISKGTTRIKHEAISR